MSLALVAGFGVVTVRGMTARNFSASWRRLCCLAWPSFFACGWIGGGDAKLAAATALWLGFDQLMNYLLYASLIGGVMTLLMIRLRTMPLPAALQGQEWAQRLHRLDGGVPYGIALAAAALLVYPNTSWMKTLGM